VIYFGPQEFPIFLLKSMERLGRPNKISASFTLWRHESSILQRSREIHPSSDVSGFLAQEFSRKFSSYCKTGQTNCHQNESFRRTEFRKRWFLWDSWRVNVVMIYARHRVVRKQGTEVEEKINPTSPRILRNHVCYCEVMPTMKKESIPSR
jgi:hypothetical protein